MRTRKTYRDIDGLEAFARHYGLKLTADACDDPVIRGTNGHLWWEPRIGLAWTAEGPVKYVRRIRNLLRVAVPRLFTGDGGYDLDARGIPPELYRSVITLSGVKRSRTSRRS